ncbi:MAG: four helix bundle protein [Ignavibacteriaceae bacterium]|nr:four helix bundle protein [Ignavibacteriaceae bacterium]
MNENLNDRLFNFAVNVLKFLKKLPRTPEINVIRYQLAKSSTSSGANYEEAQAGSSKPDFNNKVRISLREMRESNYWLRIIKATVDDTKLNNDLLPLIDESTQLKKILGSIVSKTNK